MIFPCYIRTRSRRGLDVCLALHYRRAARRAIATERADAGDERWLYAAIRRAEPRALRHVRPPAAARSDFSFFKGRRAALFAAYRAGRQERRAHIRRIFDAEDASLASI